MEIIIKERDSKGFALAQEDGKRMGMMTYSIAGPSLIIVDHTEVEEEYKKKGVGLEMLHKIVEMAREQDKKIMPLCPFANAMFKRHEDIRDVLK